ncbi:hypothetical protein [Methylobacterium trifolii]|uniref:Uncharacterized protein n=1 Tax=Methylobacterium trifolii TaxID=1003092 RepID=A0ABQ4U4Y3_9HYPH|nr:hypothetical protein [Methylobacterium trifolii]GJE62503.1 hypothetical protein MPOCJGCO_4636 [Methylobacterium trifolii]
MALRAELHGSDTPGIALALALAERGLGLRAARDAATQLFDHGFVVVALPRLDGLDGLRRALCGTGAEVVGYESPDTLDARAIGAT